MLSKNKLSDMDFFPDELEGKIVPPARSVLSMTLSSWVLIPVHLTTRSQNQHFGFSGT